jgi:hypothetical protein
MGLTLAVTDNAFINVAGFIIKPGTKSGACSDRR